MLTALGERVDAGMREYLQSARGENESRHQGYVDYYSDALRERVAQVDGQLIERYGYRFGA